MNSRNAWPDQRKRPDSSGRCWNGRAADGAGLDEGEIMAPFSSGLRDCRERRHSSRRRRTVPPLVARGCPERGRLRWGPASSRSADGVRGGDEAGRTVPRAGARGPGWLVGQEPRAMLDPWARHDFMATVITAMAEDGVSVVLSSHVLAELERVADYLILVSRGRVQGAGEVDDLLARYRVLTGPPAEADSLAARPGVARAWRGGTPAHLLIETKAT